MATTRREVMRANVSRVVPDYQNLGRGKMKNILTILKEQGIEVPEDKEKELMGAVAENYRTIVDYDKQKAKIDALEKTATEKDGTIDDLSKQLKGAEGSAEKIEKLQKTINDYEAAETDRKKQADENKKREAFEARFNAALGERKFANSLVAESVRAKAFEVAGDHSEMDMKTVIDSLTKDADSVFVNQNKPAPEKLPKPKGQDEDRLDIHNADDLRKLSAAEINEHWDQVKKILKQ